MDRIGTDLAGKYRIVRRIGAGGMGEVYEAVHRGTDRPVAVKLMRSELVDRPDALVRFDREARAAGRIGHHGICEILDVGRTDDGAPFLVLPLLLGRPLSALLRDEPRLAVPRAADVAAQTLAALAAAHAAGILHRDLKPENIFLARVGDRHDVVKLLDFGLAGFLDRRPGDDRPTRDGGLLGTPAYMSPEQARGILELDARADLYAVGVLLYEMLTGRTPFRGRSDNALLAAIMLDPFPPPRALRPDLPAPLEEVVLRAMSRERERRHPDALAMRRALLDAVGPAAAQDPAPLASHRTAAAGIPPAEPDAASPRESSPATTQETPSEGSSSGGLLRPAVTREPSVAAPRQARRRRAAVALALLATAGAAAAVAVLVSDAEPDVPGTAADGESLQDRRASCRDVVEHLWSLTDAALRSGRRDEVCGVIREFAATYGVAWTQGGGGATPCGTFEGREIHLPPRARFQADIRSWCESGRIGGIAGNRWGTKAIACNRNVSRIGDVRECWGL